MKKVAKRTLAIVLALMMLFSCVGVSAATEEKTGYEPIRISCTMYGDAQTQRGFTWFTENGCDSSIQIVTSAQYALNGFNDAQVFTGETSNWEGYFSHKVVVTGLKPGTTYKYRVGTTTKDQWGTVGTFKTDNGDGKFSFIAIADVQASSLENFEQAALVMDAAMESNKKAEFVVNLGDFVFGC